MTIISQYHTMLFVQICVWYIRTFLRQSPRSLTHSLVTETLYFPSNLWSLSMDYIHRTHACMQKLTAISREVFGSKRTQTDFWNHTHTHPKNDTNLKPSKMAQNTPKTNAKHKKRPQKTPQYKQPDILSALATSITSMSTPSSSSLPDWIFVDKHRVLSPHLRNCIYW